MQSHFIRGAVRVEYRVQLEEFGKNCSRIRAEHRIAGGNGAVPALALAQLGARVQLEGNAIGTDSHGRFLLAQLQDVPNVELQFEVSAEVVTPYAILIRGESGAVQTLLSPEAAALEGAQDYEALLRALKTVLAEWNEGQHPRKGAEIARLLRDYDTSFGGFASLRGSSG